MVSPEDQAREKIENFNSYGSHSEVLDNPKRTIGWLNRAIDAAQGELWCIGTIQPQADYVNVACRHSAGPGR
jgi:hypothetical protein